MNAHHDPTDTHQFDPAYWEAHWAEGGTQRDAAEHDAGRGLPASPYLPAELGSLVPGTALDAGCGVGTETLWLADRGWQVTGADLSATALAEADRRAQAAALQERVEWVEADLTQWEPGRTWDLVATHYAHPNSGQLEFYDRLGSLVSPGGTLLIVGHRHGGHADHGANADHGAPGVHDAHGPSDHPEGSTATLTGITGLFTGPAWTVEAAYENERTLDRGGRELTLRDVVVRLRRDLP